MKKLSTLNKLTLKKISPRAAMTDKQSRAKVAQLHAEGAISTRDVRNVESVMRQSRRVNAKYQSMHVHTDVELDYVAQGEAHADSDLGAHVAETRLEQQSTDSDQKAELNAQKQAETKADTDGSVGTVYEGPSEGAAEIRSFEKPESEPAASNSEGLLTFVGPHFNQTQRLAAGKVSAARRLDELYELLAWQEFEREHDAAAGEIDKVWSRADALAEALRNRDPDSAFARAADSYIKKNVRTPTGQSKRLGMLAQNWRDWRDYLKTYRRANPHAALPAGHPGIRYPDAQDQLKFAVMRECRGTAIPLPTGNTPMPVDRLVADWVARGRPIGRCNSPFRLRPMRIREEGCEAGPDLYRIRCDNNNEQFDYPGWFWRYQPKSLLPPF